jgi:hypothetical protein
MQECNPARNNRLRLIETGEEPGTEQDNVPSPAAKVPPPGRKIADASENSHKKLRRSRLHCFHFPFVLQQPFPRL